MLELKNISKYYNAGTVNEMCLFNDFNLSIDDGEFVSVVGSNGSGKTSMLNLICGSIPVDSGTIVMGGTDITKNAGVQAPAPHRPRLPAPGDGNLSEYDDPREYGSRGQ